MSPQNSRTRALVLLAPAAPVAFAGWLLWQSVSGDDKPEEPRAAASSQSPQPRNAGRNPAAGEQSPSSTADAKPQIDKKPLTGKVVVLDPGHNPNNRLHTTEINRKVDIGTNAKECDTTGTATNSGYPEADFTLDVARRARTLLQAQGATVKLTHDGKRAWGPCIDERAAIGNKADADAVVSIHADGAGGGERGFHVILPKAVHEGGADNRAIVAPSRELGLALKKEFAKRTGTAVSNYTGDGAGFTVRSDLGGLNLSTVPKVFIECGNMRDSKDAAHVTDDGWRQRAAHGIVDGITVYLAG